MENRERLPYLIEEDVMVVELYSRTPLTKIRRDNPEVVELAGFLTYHGRPRTPSAIKFKMENLKSIDETYLDNGRRRGMSNISSQLSDVWYRFCNNGFADIDLEVKKARKSLEKNDHKTHSVEEYFVDNSCIEGRTISRTIEVRANQNVFRSRVLATYENTCCVTGINISELLRASHIKPWCCCQKDFAWQRMDVRNGLCLNALHDRAFDEGFMSIDEDMRVMFSKRIHDSYDTDSISRFFQPYEGKRIDSASRIPAGEEYLDYHRKNLFIGS